MKKLSILLLTVLSISLFSCKDNTKEVELEIETVDNTVDTQETYEIVQTEAVFKDPQVETAFNQYLRVETALVNTDAKSTTEESLKLASILKEMEADEAIQTAIAKMATTDDIATQREAFENLSEGMEKILEGSLESGILYKQSCPMAFNNQGAYWISSSKDILNPYFGDKMLKCGRVDSEIK